jgi:hypothetical protein
MKKVKRGFTYQTSQTPDVRAGVPTITQDNFWGAQCVRLDFIRMKTINRRR